MERHQMVVDTVTDIGTDTATDLVVGTNTEVKKFLEIVA